MGELGSKSTLEEIKQVAKDLKKEFSIEEVGEKLQQMNCKVAMAFGDDFAEDLYELMALVAGIEILEHPESPFFQAYRDLEVAYHEQTKLIALELAKHKSLLAENNNLRACLSKVRKMLKDLPDGLHKEASRLRDKTQPTQLELLLLICEERFRDILIRTKGIC